MQTSRQTFLSATHRPSKTPVCWVRHGVLLDEHSEHALEDRAMETFIALSANLEMLKRKLRR